MTNLTSGERTLAKNIQWVLEENAHLRSEPFSSGNKTLQNIHWVYPDESLPFFQALARKLKNLISKQGAEKTSDTFLKLSEKIRDLDTADWQDPSCLGPVFNFFSDDLPGGTRKMSLGAKQGNPFADMKL